MMRRIPFGRTQLVAAGVMLTCTPAHAQQTHIEALQGLALDSIAMPLLTYQTAGHAAVRELTGHAGRPLGGIDPAVWIVALRISAALLGLPLFLFGATEFSRGTSARGAAAALVLAVVAFYFAATGQLPRWWRR